VLKGGVELLHQIDLVIAELSFVRYDEQALVFNEILNPLDRDAFRFYDDTGILRSAIDVTLSQKRWFLFVKTCLFLNYSGKLPPEMI
jgi:hypothetical protein